MDQKNKNTKINIGNSNNDGQLKLLMEENIRLSQEILSNNIRIRKYMKIRTVISIIWIIIIMAPIILAIIWLPPFLQDFIKEYNSIFGGGEQALKALKL